MTSLKRNIFQLLAGALTLFGTAACSDSLFDAPETPGVSEYDSDTQLVLNIALPVTNSGTRADSDPSTDECAVSSLRLVAFCETGGVENRSLPLPSSMPVDPSATPQFQVKGMQPGNYRIYIAANIPEESLRNVSNEDDLKKVILDYSETLPEPGKLPMIYEPTAGTVIKPQGEGTPVVHTLSMRFACVKVRYNIIFDKSVKETSDVFGANGMLLTSVNAHNVSKSACLVKNPGYLPAGRTLAATGKYYDSYTENRANESKNNADVISVSGEKDRPTSPAQKWVWQGVMYLPERYAERAGDQTSLHIKADVTDPSGNRGSVHCAYTLPLGGYNGDASSTELPRNTYYEIIAKVKGLGDAELDTKIVARDWMEQNISTDFVSTYLKLSKSVATVTSFDNDVISYEKDGRGGVELNCATNLPVNDANGHPALIFDNDETKGTVTVKVNPEVDILSVPRAQRKGVADCWVRVGNIKKTFKVNYDITPFFIVEPVAVRIDYKKNDPQYNTKEFEYRTNLGGLRITTDGNFNDVKLQAGRTSFTSTVSGQNLTVSCANPGAATGKLIVKATNEPVTTVVHYFGAYPAKYANLTDQDKADMENGGMERLSVTVLPELAGYRINFRAINDYHVGSYKQAATTEFLTLADGTKIAFPTEGGANNWIDFWDQNNIMGKTPSTDGHRVYIYTQFGETTGTTITGPVWVFTAGYDAGADMMKADNNNTGWYYYDLGENKSPVFTQNMHLASDTQKNYYNIPRPGETLLIFTSGWDRDFGATLHRMSHHLDPGISLFDYEDREGYYVYDPTSEPYYYIFDDKPVIEDVNFKVYSDAPVTGWYKRYGNATNDVPSEAQRYSIYSNSVNVTTETVNGKKYYVSTITLKCPRGEYSKGITLKFGASSSGNTTPHRVYLGEYSGWGRPPRIYLYKGGNEYTSWNNTPEMKQYSGDSNVYYFDLPSGYDDATVIFCSNDRSKQMPASGGWQIPSNKNVIFYSNNDSGYNAEYGPQPSSNTGTVTTEAVLFNGRAYPGNKGYFNTQTKQWSSSPN